MVEGGGGGRTIVVIRLGSRQIFETVNWLSVHVLFGCRIHKEYLLYLH